MLKKIDGLDAKRYRAIRALYLLSVFNHARYLEIMANAEEDEATVEGFDRVTDQLIEAVKGK